MVQPSSTLVLPNVKPPPISDMPPAAEPRQVSIPAAVRPGATTVGVVVRRLGASPELITAVAPDEVPTVWAYTGVDSNSIVKATYARIQVLPDATPHQYFIAFRS